MNNKPNSSPQDTAYAALMSFQGALRDLRAALVLAEQQLAEAAPEEVRACENETIRLRDELRVAELQVASQQHIYDDAHAAAVRQQQAEAVAELEAANAATLAKFDQIARQITALLDTVAELLDQLADQQVAIDAQLKAAKTLSAARVSGQDFDWRFTGTTREPGIGRSDEYHWQPPLSLVRKLRSKLGRA